MRITVRLGTTLPIEAALRELPTVADASVSVRLPNVLAVDVTEREPILVWDLGPARRYLVDVEGTLFARLDPEDAPAAAEGLPRIQDRRAASVGLAVGRSLEAVDLDAARRLASLVPQDVGSEAERLEVIVNDQSGFVVTGPEENLGGYTMMALAQAVLDRGYAIAPANLAILRRHTAYREWGFAERG